MKKNTIPTRLTQTTKQNKYLSFQSYLFTLIILLWGSQLIAQDIDVRGWDEDGDGFDILLNGVDFLSTEFLIANNGIIEKMLSIFN